MGGGGGRTLWEGIQYSLIYGGDRGLRSESRQKRYRKRGLGRIYGECRQEGGLRDRTRERARRDGNTREKADNKKTGDMGI